MWLNLQACAVDLKQGLVHREGVQQALTPLELGVLRALAQPPLRTWSRDELLAQVWGGGSERALESTVRRLRGKLERDPRHPAHLQKRYGKGYALVLELAGSPAPRGEVLAWIHRLAERDPVSIWGPPGCGLRALRERAGDGVQVALGGEGSLRVLVGPLDPEQAQIFLRGQLLRPLSDLSPLLRYGQGLPEVLAELAERALVLDPEELIAGLRADPAGLLPRCHAQAQAFWSELPDPLRRACAPMAWVQREGLSHAEAVQLLGLETLESLYRAGALLRSSGPSSTLLAMPCSLRPLAQSAEGAARYADHVLERARLLKPLVHQDQGNQAVTELVALEPELHWVLEQLLVDRVDQAAELVSLVNTSLRRRGKEAVIEALQLQVLPHSARLSARAAAGLFQERSERLRMAGDLVAAMDFARRGLERSRECDEPEELGLAIAQVAILHHHGGDYLQALPAYQEALEVLSLAPRHRATLLSNLAAVQRALGQGPAAEATLRSLLAEDLDASKRFGVHRALAFLYINRGEHGLAEQAHLRMTPLLVGREGSMDGAILGMQRGLLALDQGAGLAALAALEPAAELALSIGEHRTQAMALDYAGAACLLLQRPARARELLAQSAQAYALAGRPELGAWPLAWRAMAALEPELAQQDLERAEALGGAEELSRLGRAHLRLLQASTASALRQARQSARRVLASLASEAQEGAEIRVALRWLRARWALH